MHIEIQLSVYSGTDDVRDKENTISCKDNGTQAGALRQEESVKRD